MSQSQHQSQSQRQDQGQQSQSQSQSQIQQGRDAAQFQLRLPDDLKTRIQDAAEMSGRSVNSEIVVALMEKFSPARMGAKALVQLFRYIGDAPNAADHQERVNEAIRFLKPEEPSLQIETSRDGTITISANPP